MPPRGTFADKCCLGQFSILFKVICKNTWRSFGLWNVKWLLEITFRFWDCSWPVVSYCNLAFYCFTVLIPSQILMLITHPRKHSIMQQTPAKFPFMLKWVCWRSFCWTVKQTCKKIQSLSLHFVQVLGTTRPCKLQCKKIILKMPGFQDPKGLSNTWSMGPLSTAQRNLRIKGDYAMLGLKTLQENRTKA